MELASLLAGPGRGRGANRTSFGGKHLDFLYRYNAPRLCLVLALRGLDRWDILWGFFSFIVVPKEKAKSGADEPDDASRPDG